VATQKQGRETQIKKKIDKLVPPNVPVKFLENTRIGTERALDKEF